MERKLNLKGLIKATVFSFIVLQATTPQPQLATQITKMLYKPALARTDIIASSPQNKCAAGATQRIQQVNGTWGIGESYWSHLTTYKMVLTESQNIHIDLVSDEADTRLTLWNANHNILETNDNYDSPSSSNARITRQLSTGVYYVEAAHDNNADHSILRDYFLCSIAPSYNPP